MNIIDCLYTYRGFYTICEVTQGHYFQSIERATKKYETTIYNALNYTLEIDELSHMSLQKYNTYLDKNTSRDTKKEASFFPYIVEFEPKIGPKEQGFFKEYKKALGEASKYYRHLIEKYDINCDDIAIFITPKRSIYIAVSPKIFGAKPSADLHKIYRKMFLAIDEELTLDRNYVDDSFFKSYQLIKTPNSQYYGGYVVLISDQEFRRLENDPRLRIELTRNKRPLDRNMPCKQSKTFTKLYMSSKKTIWNENKKAVKKKKSLSNQSICKCIGYINQQKNIEGHRNFFLTSNSIFLKNQGFSIEETLPVIQELALQWNYDDKNVMSIVHSVYRNNYNFSCQLVQEELKKTGNYNLCSSCVYNKNNDIIPGEFSIHLPIIVNLLKEKRAYLRHYITYLELSRKGFLNNQSFEPTSEGFNIRVIKELINFSGHLVLHTDDKMLRIENKASKHMFYIPVEFIDKSIHKELGSRLKHYLSLFCAAWRRTSNNTKKYLYFKLAKDKIMRILSLTSDSSFYKMLKDLKALGLIQEINNGFIRLYFQDYRVIEIEEHTFDNREKDHRIESSVIEEQIHIKDLLIAIGQNNIYSSLHDEVLSQNKRYNKRRKIGEILSG